MDHSPSLFWHNADYSSVATLAKHINDFFEKADILREIRNKRVLLKPNLLGIFPPEKAVTTHPAVIEAVVRVLQEYGAHIGIGDSPGGIVTKINIERLKKKTGLEQILQKYKDAEYEDFDSETVTVSGEGTRIKTYTLAAALKKYDFVINVPKLKTHMFQTLTCGVKNLFGFVPGREKAKFHLKLPSPLDFADMLIDIALMVKPIFTVVDAIVAMEGEGPSAGKPKSLNLLFASEDVFLLDAAIALKSGLGFGVPVVKRAVERGIIKRTDISAAAQNLPLFSLAPPKGKTVDQRVPYWLRKTVRNLVSGKPYVDKNLCISCGICFKNCPPRAIVMKNGYPRIDYSVCIRCFCCHELCPVSAMKIKKPLLSV